jgi:hypothetical protein
LIAIALAISHFVQKPAIRPFLNYDTTISLTNTKGDKVGLVVRQRRFSVCSPLWIKAQLKGSLAICLPGETLQKGKKQLLILFYEIKNKGL